MIKNRYQKAYYEENKENILKITRKYHKTKKGKKAVDKARRKERDNLTDNYIRQSIYVAIYNTTGKKIIRMDIPQYMIKQYRKVQLVKRQLKDENKKTIKKSRKCNI